MTVGINYPQKIRFSEIGRAGRDSASPYKMAQKVAERQT
jgi:hypothetical protein